MITLILSVGLIPENKLLEDAGIAIDPHTNGAVVDENLQTNVPGVFSAGNVLHVHDLVDFVSMGSEALARHAAAYVEGKGIDPCTLDVKCGEGRGPHHSDRRSAARTTLACRCACGTTTVTAASWCARTVWKLLPRR